MRKFFNMIAMSLLLFTAACVTAPDAQPSATFNNTAAQIERSVLTVQTTATALLRSKTITLAQDQLIQKQVDLVHTGVVLAKSLQNTSPVQAMIQLTSAKEQLDALKKQTGATP